MSNRKRGGGAEARRCLAELTRRVVRVMIGVSPKWLLCNDVADLLGVTNTRRLYDVLDTLYALGCVHMKCKHHYQWKGRPALQSLPPLPETREQTIASATQRVVRFFATRAEHIWRGRDVKHAMKWTTRPRVLYDVLSVFRGIGLISPRPEVGVYAFVWSPGAVLPLVVKEPEPEPESKEDDDDDDEDTRSMPFILDSPSLPPAMPMPDFEDLLLTNI